MVLSSIFDAKSGITPFNFFYLLNLRKVQYFRLFIYRKMVGCKVFSNLAA